MRFGVRWGWGWSGCGVYGVWCGDVRCGVWCEV